MQRKTSQRSAIRDVLQNARRPLTPQEITDRAQDECPGLGIATVYRAVKSLVDEQWLSVVQVPNEPARYELASKPHHHHFHCRQCNRTFDLEGCPGNLKALLPAGFHADDHEILFYGLCPKCSGEAGLADAPACDHHHHS